MSRRILSQREQFAPPVHIASAGDFSGMDLPTALNKGVPMEYWLEDHPDFIGAYMLDPKKRQQLKAMLGTEAWNTLQEGAAKIAEKGDQQAYQALDTVLKEELKDSWTWGEKQSPSWFPDASHYQKPSSGSGQSGDFEEDETDLDEAESVNLAAMTLPGKHRPAFRAWYSQTEGMTPQQAANEFKKMNEYGIKAWSPGGVQYEKYINKPKPGSDPLGLFEEGPDWDNPPPADGSSPYHNMSAKQALDQYVLPEWIQANPSYLKQISEQPHLMQALENSFDDGDRDLFQDVLELAAQDGNKHAYNLLDPHRQQEVHQEWDYARNTPEWFTNQQNTPDMEAVKKALGPYYKGDDQSDDIDDLLKPDPWGQATIKDQLGLEPDTNQMTLKELLDAGASTSTVMNWLNSHPNAVSALQDPQNPSHEHLVRELGPQLVRHLPEGGSWHAMHNTLGKQQDELMYGKGSGGPNLPPGGDYWANNPPLGNSQKMKSFLSWAASHNLTPEQKDTLYSSFFPKMTDKKDDFPTKWFDAMTDMVHGAGTTFEDLVQQAGGSPAPAPGPGQDGHIPSWAKQHFTNPEVEYPAFKAWRLDHHEVPSANEALQKWFDLSDQDKQKIIDLYGPKPSSINDILDDPALDDLLPGPEAQKYYDNADFEDSPSPDYVPSDLITKGMWGHNPGWMGPAKNHPDNPNRFQLHPGIDAWLQSKGVTPEEVKSWAADYHPDTGNTWPHKVEALKGMWNSMPPDEKQHWIDIEQGKSSPGGSSGEPTLWDQWKAKNPKWINPADEKTLKPFFESFPKATQKYWLNSSASMLIADWKDSGGKHYEHPGYQQVMENAQNHPSIGSADYQLMQEPDFKNWFTTLGNDSVPLASLPSEVLHMFKNSPEYKKLTQPASSGNLEPHKDPGFQKWMGSTHGFTPETIQHIVDESGPGGIYDTNGPTAKHNISKYLSDYSTYLPQSQNKSSPSVPLKKGKQPWSTQKFVDDYVSIFPGTGLKDEQVDTPEKAQQMLQDTLDAVEGVKSYEDDIPKLQQMMETHFGDDVSYTGYSPLHKKLEKAVKAAFPAYPAMYEKLFSHLDATELQEAAEKELDYNSSGGSHHTRWKNILKDVFGTSKKKHDAPYEHPVPEGNVRPSEKRRPVHLDSPLFRAEDRPKLPNGKTYISPYDWNPPTTSDARPEVRWDNNDFEEDEVLPGMPTENRSVKIYRGEPIDLRHPDAARLRALIHGPMHGDNYYDYNPWIDNYGVLDPDEVGVPDPRPDPPLPGMEVGVGKPLLRKHWQGPVDPETGDPIYPTPYHNPEAGAEALRHWQRARQDNQSSNPHSYPGRTDSSPEVGLGRHWTVDPRQSDIWAGYPDSNTLPTRFVVEHQGTGEDPYRTNTGGEFPSEKELTMVPGSRMKVVDVQLKHPQQGWVSAWPNGHSEYHYSSRRQADLMFEAALTDDEWQQHLDHYTRAIEQAKDQGLHTHYQHAGPMFGWTPERFEQHQQILDDAWDELGGDSIPKNRQGLFIGGLPASGKSTVLDHIDDIPGVGPYRGNYLDNDNDYFKEQLVRRGMAPEIPGLSPMETAELLHHEADHLSKQFALRAMAQGTNLAHHTTMRYLPESRLKGFQDHGYSMNGVFMHSTPEESLAGAQGRYRTQHEEMLEGARPHGGRPVPETYIRGSASHDPAYASENHRVFDQELTPHLANPPQVWRAGQDGAQPQRMV